MYRYRKKLVSLFAVIILLFSHSVFAENQVYRLSSKSLSDKLQIAMDIGQRPRFKVFVLSNPLRLVVDVKAQVATSYENDLDFKRRGVRTVRTAMQDRNTIRLVLELNKNYRWKAYSVPADTKHPYARLLVDVYDGRDVVAVQPKKIQPQKTQSPKQQVRPAVTANNISPKSGAIVLESLNKTQKKITPKPSVKPKPRPVVKTDKPTKKTPPKASVKVPKKLVTAPIAQPIAKPIKETTAKRHRGKQIIVVIDAGHGGKDSGALGKNGTQEKMVVLQIAKKLKQKIDAISGMKAILTRSTDRYISLRGRLRLARKYKADLFVSIHADAARNRSASGSSVFILSNRGASSESARWLARRANAVDLKYGVDIGDYDKDVSNMIMQIQQDATIESSHRLANNTLQRLKGIGKLHKSHVERAGFAVLKSPDIPSMLVETAFISNPTEEKNLKSSWYQNKLADAIAGGISAYFGK